MPAPDNNVAPVGMRHARVYALDSLGRPNAPSGTVYEGIQVVGAQAYELTVPDVRRIVHPGDDAILARDTLPRQEPTSGLLRVATNDHDVHALFSATLAFVIGESPMIGHGTSKQGAEPSVGMLCYQQALDIATSIRRYRAYFLPATKATGKPTSMTDTPQPTEYALDPQVVTKHLWGTVFDAGVEGFTTGEILEAITVDLPHVAAFKGDGSQTEFLFHADRQAVSTDKIHAVTVWHNDGTVTDASSEVLATTGVTITLGTAGSAPAATDIVVVYYEYAD